MAYVRKTYDTFEVRGDYGYGSELLTTEVTHREARDAKRAYRENDPTVRDLRIVVVREKLAR